MGRRLIISGVMGVLSTLFFAAAAPHLWFLAFRPGWSTGSVPGVTGATPLGAISVQSRPFVDLYSVSPRAYREALAQASPPRPAWGVRTDPDPSTCVRVDTALCGFPWRALASEAWVPPTGPVQFRWNMHVASLADGSPILIPLRPLPLGFVADTVVFAAVWRVLLAIPVYSPRWWREGRRLRRGWCPRCGYELGWDYAGGCPECGWRRLASEKGVRS